MGYYFQLHLLKSTPSVFGIVQKKIFSLEDFKNRLLAILVAEL